MTMTRGKVSRKTTKGKVMNRNILYSNFRPATSPYLNFSSLIFNGKRYVVWYNMVECSWV